MQADIDETNRKLVKKYQKEAEFHQEIDRQNQKYTVLASQAFHSDLTRLDQEMLVRFDVANHQVYFFYASMYDPQRINVHKLLLFFIKHFNTKPKKPYSFVFFNQDANVDVYGIIKSIFLELSFNHYVYLKKFILLRPYFYHKAQDFITYNYLPSFMKSKTSHISSGKQLCKIIGADPQHVVDFVPIPIAKQQFPNMKPRKLDISDNRMNFSGHLMNEKQRQSQKNFEKDMRSFLIIKPGQEVINIDNYELSNLGIPMILEMLVFYFKTHPESLKIEGLFRKCVSIDEENQTLAAIADNNYQYLLEVQNPHIIASLIKRFFAFLKTPVIPYQQFASLMHDQGIKNKKQHIKKTIDSIPEINFLSLMYAIGFFKQYIIPNEPFNKMTAQNMSICLAPCLMRAEVSGPADLIYASKSVGVVKVLIDDFDYIFGNTDQRQQLMRKSERERRNSFVEDVCQSIAFEKSSSAKKLEEQQQLNAQNNKSNKAELKQKNQKHTMKDKIEQTLHKVNKKVKSACEICVPDRNNQIQVQENPNTRQKYEIYQYDVYDPQKQGNNRNTIVQTSVPPNITQSQKKNYMQLPSMNNINKYQKYPGTTLIKKQQQQQQQQPRAMQRSENKPKQYRDEKYIRSAEKKH